MPGRKKKISAHSIQIDEISSSDSGQVSVADQQNSRKRESTRSQIALFYVCGFLTIVAFALLAAWIRNFNVGDTKDTLIAISGILSGPLGFIIGYYFKAGHDN